ncbi:hypothetical protein VNO77_23436 [Canavalia gladiata]|uniref:Uncharacterized protein n=1 Tax=Canavalia gladiata TaxID=3824 RepID=A0AAN9L587_CANGL
MKAAHLYVLLNCEEVEPYLNKYADFLRELQPGISDSEIDNEIASYFPLWFTEYKLERCGLKNFSCSLGDVPSNFGFEPWIFTRSIDLSFCQQRYSFKLTLIVISTHHHVILDNSHCKEGTCLLDSNFESPPLKSPNIVSKKTSSSRIFFSDLNDYSSLSIMSGLSNSLVGSNLHIFTYQELKEITHNFSKSNFLGEGGFGKFMNRGCWLVAPLYCDDDIYSRCCLPLNHTTPCTIPLSSSMVLPHFILPYVPQTFFCSL